jgi:hypothetical protein
LSPAEAKGLFGAAVDIGGKAVADEAVFGGATDADLDFSKGFFGAADDIGGNAAADDDADLGADALNGVGALFDIGGNAEFDFGTLEEDDFGFDEIKGKAALDEGELDTSSDGFALLELSFLVGEGFNASSASREMILRP